jgi:hypothetical protein
MNTPQLPRTEIYRHVRVVLVRHMIDIGRLSIQISAHHLRLHGSLCRLPGVNAALTQEIVQSIFSELGKIHGIRRADGEFDNWRQVDEAGTSWVPIETKKIISPASSASSVGVFNIKDTGKHSQPAS